MRPTSHVIISVGLSALFFAWARSWGGALICFLSGILIDIDHHLDYLIETRKLPLSYKKLVYFCQTRKEEEKIYLFFHSFELILILWLLIFVLALNKIWVGLAIGISVHMACDQIVNPLKFWGYFFIYRFNRGFRSGEIFEKEYFKKIPHQLC